MESIVGRTSDIVVTPSGKQLVIHFFSRIFSTISSVEQFQIVQRELGAIVVKLVVGDGFDDSVGRAIVQEIHEIGDPDLRIELDLVDAIEVGKNAKRRYVVSELK
jgi:phenylacetate-CoA ligase